jgi:hypothetical protein
VGVYDTCTPTNDKEEFVSVFGRFSLRRFMQLTLLLKMLVNIQNSRYLQIGEHWLSS